MLRYLFIFSYIFLISVIYYNDGAVNITNPNSYFQNGRACNSTNCQLNSFGWQEEEYPPLKFTKFTLHDFLTAIPTLEESIPIHSSNNLCAKHSRFVLEKADELELWALQMLDSSGKISPGFLKGNINQLGDFDQCLNAIGRYENRTIRTNEEKIYGKYCLAAIDFTLPAHLRQLDNLIHSYNSIRSKQSDPYHRIPKFSSMYWAFCIPDSCSNDDVKEVLNRQLEKVNIPGLMKQISVEDYNCHTRNQPPSSYIGTTLALLFFAGVICFVLFATLHDIYIKNEEIQNADKIDTYDILVKSFSLKTTAHQLFNLKGAPDDIACLHGIRALNAIALLMSHKSMQLLFYPYVNRTPMSEQITLPWSMVGRSAIVYTDSFVLISGCLAAQSFLKIFDRKERKIISSFISRFIRLTPNLAAIILFCMFVLPILGNGPLWNNVVTKHADICRKNWWRNLLYVHNYFGFEEMCLTHTHQLGIDMQLYVFSPLLIYVLWKSPSLGIFISIAASAISTYLRYTVTLKNNLSPIIYSGVSVSQLFHTASLSYILPTHRATVYIMGILLGYYLHYRSTTPIKLSYIQVQFGTFLATSIGFLTMFGPYWMSNRHYKYNSEEMAAYMAYSPIMWCTALIWGILINVNSYTGTIGRFFKWPGFRVFTRIAYALYLVQFPVFFYNVGTNRSAKYYSLNILINIEEFTIIFALSALLTLLFDLPFQNITRYFKLKQAKDRVLNKLEKAN